MSKNDDIVEADDCITQALSKSANLTVDQLIALAQVNATKAVAEELRVANLIAYRASVLSEKPRNADLTADGAQRLNSVAKSIRNGLGLS